MQSTTKSILISFVYVIALIAMFFICLHPFIGQDAYGFDDDKHGQDEIIIVKVDENGELIKGVRFKYSSNDGKPVRGSNPEMPVEEQIQSDNTLVRPLITYYVHEQFFGNTYPDGSYDKSLPYRDPDAVITLSETWAPPEYELADPIEIRMTGERRFMDYSLEFKQDNAVTISSTETYVTNDAPYSLSNDPGGKVTAAFKEKYGHLKYISTMSGNGKMLSANWPIFLVINHLKDHEIKIAKKEEGGTYLEGAVFEITGTTIKGKEIEKITITSKKEAVTAGIPSGTYTLHEVTPPAGYELADDIVFTVENDGSVTIDGKKVDEVTMTDPKKNEPKPLLSISKTSNVKAAVPGDVIPYVITVKNKGDADADDVVVLDTMSNDLTYVSDDSGGVNDGQKVSWNVKVAAGATRTINVNCRINESAAGKVINNVEITNVKSEFVEPREGNDGFSIVLGAEEEKDETKIEDEEKSDGSARTGDSFGLIISLVMLAMSAAVLIGSRRRRA